MNRIINMDWIEGLKSLPDESVNCCVTSPPYYGLRDYGVAGQLGLEESPELYVQKMVEGFREVKRVLKNDGTLWVNIGDSYCATKTGTSDQSSSTLEGGKTTQIEAGKRPSKTNIPGIKPKDLIGIPWMLAFALRADGWYLRQDIIWHKPNPMPESVTDRCTKSHEYIFLLSKKGSYYFDSDSIKTLAINPEDDQRLISAQTWENKNAPDELRNGIRPRKSGNIERKPGSARGCPENNGVANLCGSVPWEGTMANKRSVWSVNTKPYPEAHFATFPEELIVDCIKAGCPVDGIVLDPFMGAGTTALVARKLDRNYIGIELNPQYVKIAENRLKNTLGMFQ